MAQQNTELREDQAKDDVRALGILKLLLGAWLIITPYWFNYTSNTARVDQTIIGIVVVVLAGLRTVLPRQRWMSVITGLAGIWAIIAPFILSYNRSVAYWNEIVVGAIVALLAFYNSSLPEVDHRTYRTTH